VDSNPVPAHTESATAINWLLNAGGYNICGMTSLILSGLLLVLPVPVQNGPNGSVTGRILSTDGKTPAAGVRVTAMADIDVGGPGMAVHASIVETESDGRYRLENIPPGRYYITAGFVTTPTYYPGVTALTDAATVTVTSGRTVEAIDFTMRIPQGLKVSGRFVVLPSPRSTPSVIALTGGFSPIEAQVRADGSFEFVHVPPGSYMLQNFFGLPPLMVVVSDKDVTGLEVGQGATGARIRGKVVSSGSTPGLLSSLMIALSGRPATAATAVPPPAAGGVSTGVIVAGFSGATSYTSRPDGDGSFEFLRVPPGTYTLRVVPAAPASLTNVTVGNQDIDGLEIRVPYQAEVSGRVVNEDGSTLQMQPGTMIEARGASSSMSSSIQGDGSFVIRLAEGNYQLGIRGLPLGSTVKSIRAGAVNLSDEQLRIAPESGPRRILVTLARVALDSIPGVKVSGRVTGVGPASLSGVRVVLAGTDVQSYLIETAPNADGTFEFPKVPQGSYTLRLNGLQYASMGLGMARLFVGRDNITGLQVPVEVRTPVSGRVTMVDASGNVLAIPPGVGVAFRRGTGSAGTSVHPPTGAFTIPLPDGEHYLSIDRLPAGVTVKSAQSGSLDLMKLPLKVEKGVAPPVIEVQLESRP
jgi:hypothetical protein